MHNYRDLDVYKKARKLVRHVYVVTAPFPAEETYVLKTQMRRSAVSIGANLAEGAGRNTVGEFRQFVGHSTGSAYELEWHATIACDVGLISSEIRDALLRGIVDVKKLLYRFRESLE